jgi:quercetin dioxygenase-like cupin family protein
MQTTRIVKQGTQPVLDVFGPLVEFLAAPEEADAYCVMLGSIPPGGSVPLHSHRDVESFFVISGAAQVLCQSGEELEWRDVHAGDFVQIPGGAKHAFRNRNTVPVVQLITTTPALGQFFREVGRPVTDGAPPSPPTPEELRRFARAAADRGHWLGSREENTAIGLSADI